MMVHDPSAIIDPFARALAMMQAALKWPQRFVKRCFGLFEQALGAFQVDFRLASTAEHLGIAGLKQVRPGAFPLCDGWSRWLLWHARIVADGSAGLRDVGVGLQVQLVEFDDLQESVGEKFTSRISN
jgi:hypothetical protein